MSDRELSRRQVLAGLTAAGSSGAFVGGGSAALLADEESFADNLAATGVVDLAVGWGADDGDATLSIDLSDGNTSGTGTIPVSLDAGGAGNPAYVWLRSTCPASTGGLADRIRATLSYEGETIAGPASLADVAERLRSGVLLGGGCVDPDEDPAVTVEWELCDDLTGGYKGPGSAAVEFEFRARQCRNRSASDPFPSVGECTPCPCCRLVGKLELEDSRVAPGRYAFSEGSGDYELVINETETKDGGSETVAVSVDVVGDGGTRDPELCEVVLKAGPDRVRYERDEFSAGECGFTGLLDSVERAGGGHHGISSITVGVCVDREDGDCPDDDVRPTGNGPGGPSEGAGPPYGGDE